jgi:hypothetical protein
VKVHEGLPLLSERGMVGEEPRDVTIFANAKNDDGELATDRSKLLTIRPTPEIALRCIGDERVKLRVGDNAFFNELVEEEALQTSVVTLIIGQWNEPLIHHEELNSTEKISWLVR